MAETPSELQTEIEQLERKHAENPDGRYFVPLANDYRKLGELDRAESLLRTGIEKHPDYLSARIVLGRCLTDRGDNAKAVREFEHVLSMDPQNLIALRSLAELSLADGSKRDARRWYDELLAVDPMNADARQALEAMGPPEEVEGSWWEPSSAVEARGAPAATPEGDALDDAEIERGSKTIVELSEIELDAAEPEFGGDDAADEPGLDLAAGSAPPEPAPVARGGAVDDYDADEARSAELDDWDLPEEVDSVEVVTETIAELYARQGLTDRAAEVYRELIRRRGGAPELEQRLRELEAAAAAERLQELGLESAPEIPAEDLSAGASAAEDSTAGEPELTDISEFGVMEPGPAMGGEEVLRADEPTPTHEATDAWELPEDHTDSATPGFVAGGAGQSGDEPAEELETIESWAPDDSFETSMESMAPTGSGAEASPRDDSDRDDPFAASFAFGFPEDAAGASEDSSGAPDEAASTARDDDLVPSALDFEPSEPSERTRAEAEPADVDAPDWDSVSSAWESESGSEEQAGASAPGATIGDYLGTLASWMPRTQPEGVATVGDAAESDELGAWESIEAEQGMPAAEVPAADGDDAGAGNGEDLESISAFTSDAEELPEAEAEPVIGLDDYFSDDAAAPAAESVPSASSEPEPEPEAAEEEDDDLESFQAWLRSLKR